MRSTSIRDALLIAIAAFGSAGCGVREADGQGLEPPEAPADGGRLAAELDPLVEELFEMDMSPGLAVAVVRDGQLAYLRGFGHADVEEGIAVDPAETLFYIASTSKSFTGLTTALLAHEGEIDLNAPLGTYIPELEFESSLSADDITIRDLLTMSDGMDQSMPFVFRTAFSGDWTEPKLIELLSRTGPSEAGRAFRYRNQPYNILGFVIERATGLPWKEAFEREVAGPLGLSRTTQYMSRVDRADVATPYVTSPDGFRRAPLTKSDANMHAAGGHLTTALDLSRWVELFLEHGVIDGERVFPARVVDAASSVQVPQDRDFSFFHRHGWGYGWDIGTYGQDTLVHRFGGYTGARPHVSFMPQHGIGVVALVNEAGLGGTLVDLAATRIYDHLLEKPDADERWAARMDDIRADVEAVRRRVAADLETRAARQRPMPLPLSAYAGTYVSDEVGTMTWTETGDGLEVRAGLVHGPAEVFDADEHAFRIQITGGGSVVQFVVEDGEVTGLRYRGFEFEKADG